MMCEAGKRSALQSLVFPSSGDERPPVVNLVCMLMDPISGEWSVKIGFTNGVNISALLRNVYVEHND